MSDRRIRFSIKNLLHIVAFVGMAIVIALQWREIGPLRADVRQMRAQLGQLYIDDASQAQAIEVRQSDPNLWRWRIYLPPAGKYKLVEFGGILPPRGKLSNREWLDALKKAQFGIGSGEYSSYLFEGELTIEASLTLVDDRWKFETHPGGGESRYAFTGNWPAEFGRIDASDVWEDQQRTYKPGEPVLLLYLPKPVKTPTPGGGIRHDVPQEPAEGIALWLEQQPPNPPAGSKSP